MSARRKPMRRWVVKAGSNMVCSGGPILLRAWMRQVAALRRQGIEVIWVTSGAIASAVDRTGFHKRNKMLSEKQALSAIGQPLVMDLYNLSLQTTGLLGAQILLSYGDLAHAERRQNFKNTVEQLLAWNVTPILNENDAVATEEIKFGDNDRLSALIAVQLKAERLVILTDVEGLFDADPRKNPSAKLIAEIPRVSASLLSGTAKAGGSARGTGGMYSKLSAAQAAGKKGIETWLIRGDLPEALLRVASEESIGTRIGKRKKKRRRTS